MAAGCAGAKHVTLDGVYHSPLGAIIAVDGKPGRPWYGEPASGPRRLPTGAMQCWLCRGCWGCLEVMSLHAWWTAGTSRKAEIRGWLWSQSLQCKSSDKVVVSLLACVQACAGVSSMLEFAELSLHACSRGLQ